MRNKFLKIFKIIILFNFIFIPGLFGSEIKFEAENIEINDKTLIKASNNIVIKDGQGLEIYGDNLLIDKEKKKLYYL